MFQPRGIEGERLPVAGRSEPKGLIRSLEQGT